jgi:hypothetical protein
VTIINRHDMTEHIRAGRATEWTQPLGPEHLVPIAAELDGTWYVILEGHNHYAPAPANLTADLTRIRAALNAADEAIARADSHS